MASTRLLAPIPESHRSDVAAALDDAFGPAGVDELVAVPGGASGALTYKVDSGGGSHLLRIEGIRGPLRNPHQTTCLLAAAEAGIAPPVRHADDTTGLLIMRWIEQRPVTDHRDGPGGVARGAGELIARLHATAPFPDTGDHVEKLGQLAGVLAASGRVAPGLLDEHRAGLAQIVAAYPWDPSSHVSCHNDPNQSNLLYDGERLWLVDWETAGRNDPMVDLASLCAHLGPTPELQSAVLRAALGREPRQDDRDRLVLASQLGRLFAGMILLLVVDDPTTPVHDDLTALSIEEFTAGVGAGELVPGTPATTIAFAKLMLATFLAGMHDPTTTGALERLSG